MLIHSALLFPETAGKTLEDTTKMFEDPNGIPYLGTPAWKVSDLPTVQPPREVMLIHGVRLVLSTTKWHRRRGEIPKRTSLAPWLDMSVMLAMRRFERQHCRLHAAAFEVS